MYEYKRIGETTSEFANRIKDKINAKKICIIGKLDPMAHGYTKILTETKLMSLYLNSDKNYTFNIVIGFSTDTDDIMGKIKNYKDYRDKDKDIINDLIYSYCLIKRQKFHKFSAIKININGISKSLHSIKNINNEDIPEKIVQVYDLIRLNEYDIMPIDEYLKIIYSRLDTINDKNTFRIDDIKESYRNLKDIKYVYFMKYNITVSSGFYIRMISNYINNNCDIPVHVFDIYRNNFF